MAHLGAVTALEELIPAPLPEPPQVEETPIGADAVVNIEAQAPLIFISKPIASRFLYGVSGASAGAITAFYIAMGMSARSIDRELNESARELLRLGPLPNEWEKANRLEFFFEDPSPYMTRQWSPTSQAKEYVNYGTIEALLRGWFNTTPINELLTAAGRLSQGVLAQRIFRVDPGPFTAHIPSRGHPRLANYLYSMLLNRGVFPGFAAREYFAGLFERYLYPKLDASKVYVEKKPGSSVTFKDFFNMTGVDLVVTGTNVSKNRTAYFSVGYTPDFSVAEAVAISMSIPLIFKPVLIDGDVNRSASPEYNENYRGLWVDGGMLNNYPIHAFDNTNRVFGLTFQNNTNSVGGFTVATPTTEERPFNRSCAGFRLGLKDNSKYDVKKDFEQNSIDIIGSFLGDLLRTILADSSDS